MTKSQGQRDSAVMMSSAKLDSAHRPARHLTSTNAIHPHLPRDVLELLLAHVFKDQIERARGILLHARGHTDAAGLGQCFEPCSDVHPVTEDVAILDHNIAHIDADPELDARVRRYCRVALGHAGLHFSRAAQRIDHAAELDQ